MLFAMGMVGSLSQCFNVLALMRESASRVSALQILGVVLGFTCDVIFFNYEIGVLNVIGLTLIIGCSILVFKLKSD